MRPLLYGRREAEIVGRSAEIPDPGDPHCACFYVVYGLAPRQTQGLMRSVAALMEFDIAVPDFSTPVAPEQRAGVAVDKVRSQSVWYCLSGGR
ncbi:transposase [Rhizobium beringeri]